MKFGKDFNKQKVPEWTEAYMDYNGLKRILHEIRENKQSKHPVINRTLSGLNNQCSSHHSKGDIEEQVIDVNTLPRNGSRKIFETNFLKNSEEGGEIEVKFFRKLDEELNKVNKFYKEKEEEVVDEANQLNKQMDALIALRIKLGKHDLELSSSKEHCLPEQTQQNPNAPEVVDAVHSKSCASDESKANDHIQNHLEVLDHVKLNKTLESPISTIKGVFKDSEGEDLSCNEEELKKTEKQLRVAFIEFYHKLHHLKHFSFMNLSAFSKMMKKYEKITSRRVSRLYMKFVDTSYLGNSNKIMDLLERVEATFIKNFSNSNRGKAMKSLRPKPKIEKHRVTFSSGFFSGCSIALLVAIVLRINTQKLLNKKEGKQYFSSIFPLYSLFLYSILHLLMYAANIYFWRRFRINYPFIFGLKRGTELSHGEVFLLSTGLAVLALSGFLAILHLDTDASTQSFKKATELVPLGLVILVLLITFCPFNILYRSSRFYFVRCLFRCIFAPLYPVTFPEFFLADQLTSQTQALRSSVLYICYYGLGEYSRRQNKCQKHGVYNTLYFVIAVIPYWLRLMQCIRRLYEDKDRMHAYNGFTYLSTIVAVLVRTVFELRKGVTWMVFALISSAVAVIANTIWDIFVDWGLFRWHSKNVYLRDKLLVSHKSVYIVAMVLDVVLRLAWMQLVLAFNLHDFHKMTITTVVSCLEIIRRGIWNFFRLENEHLNNVGKYRAFKSVPLPFSYDDEENDKDE